MFKPETTATVWLVLGHTDMRKGIDGLMGLVANQHRLDPWSGHYFVFQGRQRNRLKILYYDRTGYCLWIKRLGAGVFRWPRSEAETRAITGEQLGWLLAGLDIGMAHQAAKYLA